MHFTPETVSNFIRSQFPSFYNEDGDNFIQFLEAYFEWLEEQGPIHKTRHLLAYRDIDTTLNEYLDYFVSKFMKNIPTNILGNKRLLQKHILDIYRAKGSVAGLKLLFRLLYNEEAQIYIPAADMLKPSDGVWVERRYIEVGESDYFSSYHGKRITGIASGAVAYADSAEKTLIGNKIAYVLFLNNIEGTFQVGEKISHDSVDDFNALVVVGSPNSFEVTESTTDHSIGDILQSNSIHGKTLKVIVSNTINATGNNGFIDFVLTNGGYGYSTEYGNVTVTYDGATTGNGASFYYEVSNTIPFDLDRSVSLNTFSSVAVNAASYPFGLAWNVDKDTVIANALTIETINVGTISRIIYENPGFNYNGSVTVQVTDEEISKYSIPDLNNGGIWGNNATVEGRLTYGVGLARELRLLDSGFGFNEEYQNVQFINPDKMYLTLANVSSGNFEVGEYVTGDITGANGVVTYSTNTYVILSPYSGAFENLEGLVGSETGITANVANANYLATTVNLSRGGVGHAEGFWLGSRGQLDSDKYIQDSYYYQEFSYEVQVSKPLYKYKEILKNVIHSAGNELFGKVIVSSTENLPVESESLDLGIFNASDSLLDTTFILDSSRLA